MFKKSALLVVGLTLIQSAALSAPRVAIFADDNWDMADVRVKIMAGGSFSAVDTLNLVTQPVPTLQQALQYDAIMIYGGGQYWSDSTSIAVGNLLADYSDNDRGVVVATFALGSNSGSWMLKGRFNQGIYQVMIPKLGQDQNTRRYLGTRYLPDHPILAGVNSFDGGSSSFLLPDIQLVPEATLIADWTGGTHMIAAKELANMGRRVDLNFYPPSSDARADFWVSATDGGEILANSLLWVAIPEPATLAIFALGGLMMLRRRVK